MRSVSAKNISLSEVIEASRQFVRELCDDLIDEQAVKLVRSLARQGVSEEDIGIALVAYNQICDAEIERVVPQVAEFLADEPNRRTH